MSIKKNLKISNIKNTPHTFQTTSGEEQTVKNTLNGQGKRNLGQNYK